MSERGRAGVGQARPRVWLDGQLLEMRRGSLRVDEHELVVAGTAWGEAPTSTSRASWMPRIARRRERPRRVQLWLPEFERGWLGFVHEFGVDEDGREWVGMDLVELTTQLEPPSDVHLRWHGPGHASLDGQLLSDALIDASLTEEARGALQLRLRLRPGTSPSPVLLRLAQARCGRRLVLAHEDGTVSILRDLRCVRALLRGRSDEPFDGAQLEFVFDLRARVEQAAQPPAGESDDATSAAVVDAKSWLRARFETLARAPVEGQLVAALDGNDGAAVEAQWAVYTDWLLARGSLWGDSLVAAQPPPSKLDAVAASLATLGPDGGTWHREGREWAPWLQLRWRGPFVTHMVVKPGWRAAPHPERATLRYDATGPARTAALALPSQGQEQGQGRWREILAQLADRSRAHGSSGEVSWVTPGFDLRPELAELLAAPCCRLLSPARVELVLPASGWAQQVARELRKLGDEDVVVP